MAKNWLIVIIGASVICSLMLMIQVCPDPGNSLRLLKPDTSWMDMLKNLSSLIKTEHDSLFLPQLLPRCPKSSNASLLLVIVVCSSAPNFAARRVIRSTWSNETYLRNDVKVFFIVGRSLDTATNEFIDFENDVYGDMIQYDLVDSYRNLTVKSIMMLQWVNEYCKDAKYVMKSDDDMFVHVPNLVSYLVKDGRERLLMGDVIANAQPVKSFESKWYTPLSAYDEGLYPNYLSGTGYVMSQDVVPLLYQSALKIPLLFLEDVFITGVCARASGLVPKDHEGFSYVKRRNHPCLFQDIITAHKMSGRELLAMWKKLHDPSTRCKKWSRFVTIHIL